MIDTTKLQSSSLFAGFANQKVSTASISIPANQAIPGFGGGAFAWFTDVPRPSNQSLATVLFQVIGPSTIYGLPYDPNQWKSSASDYATWYQPDNVSFEIQCDVYRTYADKVRLRVTYFNTGFGATSYPPAVTVNAKLYFFKYPWE